MAGFDGKGALLTQPFGQMFEFAKGKFGSFPTPNIAPTGRPIAARFSFFIRCFLVSLLFFAAKMAFWQPVLLKAPSLKCHSKSGILRLLIHIRSVDKPTCPQFSLNQFLFSPFFNLRLTCASSG
jgi:hypothetical protein